MKWALSIAGSDPSGAAGIQADLKAFCAMGVEGTVLPAALTVQDGSGLRSARALEAGFVREQVLAALASRPVAAAKCGMLMSAANIAVVAEIFAARPELPLVVDPVLAASSGGSLAEPDAEAAYLRELLPVAALFTPNLGEAARLLKRPKAGDREGMQAQAEALLALGAKAVLLKGGHLGGAESPDLYAAPDGLVWLEGSRLSAPGARGTGCRLSAAVTAQLALGREMPDACHRAKDWLRGELGA